MTTPPTPIPLTTRTGSRSAVHRLNQPMYVRKREPSRSNRANPVRHGSSGSPGHRTRLDRVVESEASPLLVILHYLLKNNTTFMSGIGQGQLPPEGGGLASSDGRTAPLSLEGGRGV